MRHLIFELLMNKRSRLVWARHHAIAATNTSVFVDKDHTISAFKRCARGADINTRCVLTLVTGCREEVTAPSGEVYFKNLYPFLTLGSKMPHDTRLGTLGRYAKPGTAITLFQVDNHTPGTSILTGGSQRGGAGGGTHLTRYRVNKEGRNQQ